MSKQSIGMLKDGYYSSQADPRIIHQQPTKAFQPHRQKERVRPRIERRTRLLLISGDDEQQCKHYVIEQLEKQQSKEIKEYVQTIRQGNHPEVKDKDIELETFEEFLKTDHTFGYHRKVIFLSDFFVPSQTKEEHLEQMEALRQEIWNAFAPDPIRIEQNYLDEKNKKVIEVVEIPVMSEQVVLVGTLEKQERSSLVNFLKRKAKKELLLCDYSAIHLTSKETDQKERFPCPDEGWNTICVLDPKTNVSHYTVYHDQLI